MDREEFINNKFITVAGRAASMDEFAAQIKKNLYDNFTIVAVHGLGEFGIDDKERYLAFVAGESETGKTFNAQRQKLLEAQFGAHMHNTLEDAYDFSKRTYPTFGDKEEQVQRKYQEMNEKFPAIKAEEVEKFNILEALWAAGKVHFVRCLIDDEPCVVLISVATGADEMRVRPLAILMNEDLEARVEFPDPNDD